ncbi:GNAT family N-acetyltransferase [Bacillus sp. E(2018)]|uniref:GNAT family N-acetyltransferase n=1 Tax=Bacillus sp. E(2018) TaxID=2502239 RepID=UPI0010F492AB|nr:GNAT family N-acetyltransferase [Bacillus sp. E(2018)]
MQTERLKFRPYKTEDFAFFASLWADPDVVQFIGKGVTRSEEEARKSFDEWLIPGYRDGRGLFLMEHRKSLFPIGHAGIVQQMIDGKKEYEIGFWLAKEYWGNGYATEAAQYFKEYAIHDLGITRLICLIQRKNVKSVSVASRLGMTLQKESTFNTIPVDVYSWTESQK